MIIGRVQELGTETVLIPDTTRLFLTTGGAHDVFDLQLRDRAPDGGRRVAPSLDQHLHHDRDLSVPVLPRDRVWTVLAVREGVTMKRIEGEQVLMRIFIGEHDRWEWRPLYLALI